MTPIRVVVVDDQALVRMGLRALFETEPDTDLVAEAEDGRAGLTEIRRTVPDVVLMDVRMPVLDEVVAGKSSTGIRTSMSTGVRDRTPDLGQAGPAVLGLGDQVGVRLGLEQRPQAHPDQRLVVDHDDPDRGHAGSSARTRNSSALPRPGGQLPADRLGPPAHAGDPAAILAARRPAPPVGHLDVQCPVHRDPHGRLAGAGVPQHVRQRLPERSGTPARSTTAAPYTVASATSTAAPAARMRSISAGTSASPRDGRRAAGPSAGAPQVGQVSAQPVERLATGGPDRLPEQLTGTVGLRSSTCRATPACMAITARPCPTESCTSCAASPKPLIRDGPLGLLWPGTCSAGSGGGLAERGTDGGRCRQDR